MNGLPNTARAVACKMLCRPDVALVLAALALTVAPVQAQTTGNIPVFVDPQTLGDSPLFLCGDGTSVCIGPGGSPVTGRSTLMGFTDSTELNAAGVYGEATATQASPTIGVFGVTRSVAAFSVGTFGWATDSSPSAGITVGVYGRSSSLRGRGVVGETPSGEAGVYGISTTGRGVYGTSTNNIGVYGFSRDSQGVFGQSMNSAGVFGFSLNDYAGYFAGKVHVSGFLEKPGGGFKIDHPQHPADQYLVHSFVESPDMKNIYDGIVTTDTHGDAVVTLPEYFEALNRDFRYQLTVIGAFAQAIVANKVKDNRFMIKTDKPDVEVSWQVTGIRQDAWAEANRPHVEEDKPATERGSYLYPLLFGQPEEKGVEWARHPEQMKRQKEERARLNTETPEQVAVRKP